VIATTTNNKYNAKTSRCHFRLCRNRLRPGYRFAVGISVVLCHRFNDKNISDFDDHVAISGCRMLLQSLAETFLELAMVLFHGFWDMSVSGFGSYLRLSVIIGIAERQFSSSSHKSKTPNSLLEF